MTFAYLSFQIAGGLAEEGKSLEEIVTVINEVTSQSSMGEKIFSVIALLLRIECNVILPMEK